ncbi:LysR family transcriptional regulator [Pseudomonas sp. CrR25]|nr:LysR family transcriptional regulator [Pseudomonas sp. CrR25]
MRGFDPYLTFQKLEVFCTVAQLGSVTRAADRLCVAQPVVTAHLRSMEAKVGCALVERVGRNIALTEAGERIYRWATEVITRTREMERELAGVEAGTVGNAVVASSMTIGSYALPVLVSDFYLEHREGLVTVEISNPGAAVDSTRTGGCDFAVILLAPNQELDGLVARQLWAEPLLLVSAPGSQWLDPEHLNESLLKAPFISAPRKMARRELEDALLRKHGLENRQIILEFGHPEAMKHAVKENLGLCFMLASSIQADVRRGELQIVDLPDINLELPVFLVHREDKRFSNFQTALLDHIAESTHQSDNSA